MTHERVAIVIPTYNEKDNIRKLIITISDLLAAVRIYVVDDNSPDGTAEVVKDLAEERENIRLIWRDQKQGLASAYLDAFGRILPDEDLQYIVTMDADFSHHPRDLESLLEHAWNHDMVVGSRYVPEGTVENWGMFRRFLSKYGNIYARMVTGTPIADLTAGFVLYRRELLARILQQLVESEGYAYQIEMKYLAHKLGARIKEVPITFRERQSGQSKLDRNVVWEGIVKPWYFRFFK